MKNVCLRRAHARRVIPVLGGDRPPHLSPRDRALYRSVSSTVHAYQYENVEALTSEATLFDCRGLAPLFRSQVLIYLGRHAEASKESARAIALLHEPSWKARALSNASTAHLYLGDPQRAAYLAEEGLRHDATRVSLHLASLEVFRSRDDFHPDRALPLVHRAEAVLPSEDYEKYLVSIFEMTCLEDVRGVVETYVQSQAA